MTKDKLSRPTDALMTFYGIDADDATKTRVDAALEALTVRAAPTLRSGDPAVAAFTTERFGE
jgi:hypothetical protein